MPLKLPSVLTDAHNPFIRISCDKNTLSPKIPSDSHNAPQGLNQGFMVYIITLNPEEFRVNPVS